jgi:hypothetical protein
VHLDTIIATARAAGARPELIQVLQRLPACRYERIEQLGGQLPLVQW